MNVVVVFIDCSAMHCQSRYYMRFGTATGSIHNFAACRHEMCLLVNCITFELYTCARLDARTTSGKLHLMIRYIVISCGHFKRFVQTVDR